MCSDVYGVFPEYGLYPFTDSLIVAIRLRTEGNIAMEVVTLYGFLQKISVKNPTHFLMFIKHT
jgi:hypothetical protein